MLVPLTHKIGVNDICQETDMFSVSSGMNPADY